jgi:hypothetical protein
VKKISFLPMHIALLTLPMVTLIWRVNMSLRILNEGSSANPQLVQKLNQLGAGLASGNIKVEPTQQTKLVKAAVKNWQARMHENEYAFYIELTQILLNLAVLTFLVQLSIAIGLPVWEKWRTSRANGTTQAPEHLRRLS